MSRKKQYRRDTMEEITETAAKMIVSGGDVIVKHGVDRNNRYVITVTCKRTFYMGEEQE